MTNTSRTFEAATLTSQDLHRFNQVVNQLATASRTQHHTPAVHRVPFELLAEIFKLSLETEVKPKHSSRDFLPYFFGSRRIDAKPLGAVNVAQVCTKWRHVALSTRKLWTHVKIDAVSNKEVITIDLPLPLEPAKRAAPLCTFVSVDLSNYTKIWIDPDAGFLPENAHCGNVKGVDVEGSGAFTLSMLYQWMSQFPNLTHLTLVGVDLDPYPTPVPSLCLDRLTHLHMYCPLKVTSFFTQRKWENLRSLVVDQPPDFLDEDLLPILSTNAPNLSELFIVADELASAEPRRHVKMKHLRTFVVTGYLYEEEGDTVLGPLFNPLFDSLTFPALSDLVVTDPSRINIDCLRRFLVRSGCALSSITFLPDVMSEPSELESVDSEETPIHRAALALGKELRIPTINFAASLVETRVYRGAKHRWYSSVVS